MKGANVTNAILPTARYVGHGLGVGLSGCVSFPLASPGILPNSIQRLYVV